MTPSSSPKSTAGLGPLLLFASQTGTAQDITEKILRQGSNFPGLPPCRLFSTDSYSMENLPLEKSMVLVVATAGQGDPPDSMVRCWRFLMRRSLANDSLGNLHFAVLGLGDSSYQKYNYAGKKVFRRLCQLGATPLLDLGLADDQHDLGVDGVLATWLPRLWTSLLDHYGVQLLGYPSLTLARLNEMTKNPPNKYRVVQTDGEDLPPGTSFVYPSNAFTGRLISNQRVTSPAHFQDSRLVVLSRPQHVQYKPGDVLYVQPQNTTDHVTRFLDLIGQSATTVVSLSQCDDNFPPPALPTCSLEWLARHYFDITAVPRKSFFELLSLRSHHEMERERLREFASAEGIDELLDYCHRPRRTVLEVMADFPVTSRHLRLADWFDLIGPMRARAFSLASSSRAHPTELHLLVAVVNYSTKLSLPRLGLCSNYLAGLSPGAAVSSWVRPGTLTFPTSPGTPVVMVGPGTGVAPFRSFLQDRHDILSTTKLASPSPAFLFFGCRYQSRDFYFEPEWRELTGLGELVLFTAFSRDSVAMPTGKTYVQHRVAEQGELVWRLLALESATLLLAGSAQSMPDGVRDAVKQVAKQHGGLSDSEAEKFVFSLEQSRRYQTETWS